MLRNLFGGQTRSPLRQAAPRRAPRPAAFRPAVEALEAREVMSANATVASAYYTYHGSYFVDASAHLFEHIGTDPNSGLFPISTPTGVAQVSAGTTFTQDVVFARLVNGDVYEYYGTPGNFKQQLICHNAAEISGAVSGLFSTVFVRKTDNSVSEFVYGIFGVSEVPLGAPTGINPKSATQISAGVDGATRLPSVFVNFSGALYEHTGTSPNSGWSYVAGMVPTNLWQYELAVKDISASQDTGDTVFATNGFLGSLYEYSGEATSKGLQFNATALGTGVAQVSAGLDAGGVEMAFVLKQDGSLWKHTGWSSSSGWTWIDNGVSNFAASQGQLDTVVYHTNALPGYLDAIMEYNWNTHYMVSGFTFFA
jgi:hypothetical protein